MAKSQAKAILAETSAASTEAKAPRTAYEKPELECLGAQCTENGGGALSDGSGRTTTIIS